MSIFLKDEPDILTAQIDKNDGFLRIRRKNMLTGYRDK